MTGNYGGCTGERERELGARVRVGVSSDSMSSACSKTPNLLWSFTASFDPFDCLFGVCLAFVGFVFVLGLLVCSCEFCCPDDGRFDDKFVLFCEPASGCALVVDDEVD